MSMPVDRNELIAVLDCDAKTMIDKALPLVKKSYPSMASGGNCETPGQQFMNSELWCFFIYIERIKKRFKTKGHPISDDEAMTHAVSLDNVDLRAQLPDKSEISVAMRRAVNGKHTYQHNWRLKHGEDDDPYEDSSQDPNPRANMKPSETMLARRAIRKMWSDWPSMNNGNVRSGDNKKERKRLRVSSIETEMDKFQPKIAHDSKITGCLCDKCEESRDGF